MPWYAMALSIMATQASAITFISTTGQSYVDGMRFVQFYFGLPLAMVILCATVVPIFHRARSTPRTNTWRSASTPRRAPWSASSSSASAASPPDSPSTRRRIVLSVILGWPERATTIMMGATVVTYTVLGGIKAVTWSDVQQMCIIFAGAGDLARHRHSSPAPVRLLQRRRLPRRRRRPPQRRHHPLRLERPLQHLERPHRRHLPLPLLLRLRSIAGAALPHRQIHRAKAA